VANLGFREVAEMLRERIKTGRHRPGEFLPSESELCADIHVSRTTMRRALHVLEGDDLVTVIPGRGRLVRAADSPRTTPGESRAAMAARVLREDCL
jgi:DNA-binding GntR family transcriptional regulator